ncbi:ankyrin repeat domain-containing protein [Bradyrhizobium sp. CER78]|uniref:ankyrin repeat domain-containing protein n=1 Tax=Bradyrhizobium sp. CER78 TaxID=3039162 RepID=UPI00244949A7|nr:ankyrin repeat domain-containing protein [Bradyrhizobium sp. CER78]MDH2385065.1 ankyrin repeat domain-containing protein [Bradyrhizobium sp. CER78]
MTTDVPRLRNHDPLAVELTAAVKAGEAERLRTLLASHPELARCVVVDAKGGGRSPLHLLADWPGHNPNAAAIVQILTAAGADLDTPADAMWHRETPLHWAASSDDVALIDALLDAGADIEHEGSSIDGGPPLSCAVGYGQWAAARRLVERGARTALWQEAALGMMPEIVRRLETAALPAEEISGPFWNACRGGQLATARYLLERGADLNWPAPWSGQTPLDIAEQAEHREVAAWLLERGATRAEKTSEPDAS